MVVPGISGSFLLILLGYYATFIEAAKGLNLPILAVAATGAAIGIMVISRGINFLLAKFHAPTYYAIIGLVGGSVLAVIANAYAPKDPSLVQSFSPAVEIALNAGALIAGLVPALLLGADRKGKGA
jgi:putative membrane protein